MESPEDMQALAAEFRLDLDTKINTTEKVKESITWSPFNRKTVEQLYRMDFKRFGYDIFPDNP